MLNRYLALLLVATLSACATPRPESPLRGHLHQATEPAPPVATPTAADTIPEPSLPRYSLTVHEAPIRPLLLGLAKDAGIELDLAPEVDGVVSLHAREQALEALLPRLTRPLKLRYQWQADGSLFIGPDHPYVAHYAVDYVNQARTVSGSVANAMSIGNPATSGGPAGAGNLSSTRIENASRHQFWASLEQGLRQLIQVPDADKPAAGSPTAHTPGSAVMPHPEAGLISIFATQAQHGLVREFLDRSLGAAHRQVMIEATIVEVLLSQGQEQGIDWNGLVGRGLVEFAGNPLKGAVNLKVTRDDAPRALISLLERFGTTRVLSSPRLAVLNNQTALLKVVENYVYFSVKADTTTTANVGTTVTYTTTPQTVAVGLVLGVTPQIAADGQVILNVRPTITSIGREVPDPNPDLRRNGIENLVPMIRTREIESVMRVAHGQIAVLGGLMEDRADYRTQRLPGVGDVPLAGELFTNRQNQTQKTELVIFLRPLVQSTAHANAQGLPDARFFEPPRHALRPGLRPSAP